MTEMRIAAGADGLDPQRAVALVPLLGDGRFATNAECRDESSRDDGQVYSKLLLP